jgi:hypothetical protein
VFQHNQANDKGGAIYYDSYRPDISEVQFLNNSAKYGNNIASYPVSIKGVSNFSNITSIIKIIVSIYLDH